MKGRYQESVAEEELGAYVTEDPEDEDRKRIPALKTMESEIAGRYMDVMVRGLNESLLARRLDSIFETPVLTKSFSAADIHLEKDGVTCFRRSARDLVADIVFWTRMKTLEDGREVWFESDLGMTLSFCFSGDGITCEFEALWDLYDKPDRAEMIQMDSSLNVMIRRGEREKCADDTWRAAGVDGIREKKCRNPRLLAEGLGLKIRERYVPAAWGAVVCLERRTIRVYENGEAARKTKETREETFEADTLIINACGRYGPPSALKMYQHCARYEWMYMFFRFQGSPTDDPHDLPMISVPKDRKADLKSLLFGLGNTNRMAYSVMLPREVMESYISGNEEAALRVRRFHDYQNHQAFVLEEIGKRICREESLYKCWIRTRFLSMNHLPARNIFLQTDGHSIDAFSTVEESLDSGEYTLGIGYRARVLELFRKDELFRELMESGNWVFADGLIVRDLPDYVARTSQGPRITRLGNSAADTCCLRFTQKWHPSIGRYSYEFGKVNYEWAFKAWGSYEGTECAETLQRNRELQIRHLEELPSFGETLTELMRGRAKADQLEKEIRIRCGTLKEYCDPKKQTFCLDDVAQLCIQLHLKPWQSRILFEKAGMGACTEKGQDADHRWAMVCCFYQEDVQDLMKYLKVPRLNRLRIPAFGEGGGKEG